MLSSQWQLNDSQVCEAFCFKLMKVCSVKLVRKSGLVFELYILELNDCSMLVLLAESMWAKEYCTAIWNAMQRLLSAWFHRMSLILMEDRILQQQCTAYIEVHCLSFDQEKRDKVWSSWCRSHRLIFPVIYPFSLTSTRKSDYLIILLSECCEIF